MEKRIYTKGCPGCIYFGWVNSYMGCCNYYLMTDKRRPCPPGKGCTVKEKTKKMGQQLPKEPKGE